MSARIGPSYTPTDADAKLFIDTALISAATQKRAIDVLVKDFKGAYNGTNYWQYILFCFPIVGGNEYSHKFNLKNPAIYFLQYSTLVTYTHASTGMKGGAKINNFFCNGNVTATTNAGMFAYVRENTNNGISIYQNSAGQSIGFTSRSPSDTITAWSVNSATTVTGVTDGRGFLQHSRAGSGAGTLKFYINGVLRATGTGESSIIGSGQNSRGLALNGVTTAVGVDGLSSNPNEISFGMTMNTIALTDSDNLALYEIVQKYQTTLGRQV